MKKIFALFLFLINWSFSLSSQTVAVLNFDTSIEDYEENAVIMADMLRNEIVNQKKFNVVNRDETIDVLSREEIAEAEQSDFRSEDNTKSLGKILNADYLVIGKISIISNSRLQGNIIDKVKSYLPNNEKKEVVVRLVDVETGEILASSSVELSKFTDFSKYTKEITRELEKGFEKTRETSSLVMNRIENTSEEMFNGSWTAEIKSGKSVYIYEIAFQDNGQILVAVTEISNGKEKTSKGNGFYRFNPDSKALSVNVNIMKGGIKKLDSILWKSFVTFSDDEMSFVYNISVPEGNGAKTVRSTFFKVE